MLPIAASSEDFHSSLTWGYIRHVPVEGHRGHCPPKIELKLVYSYLTSGKQRVNVGSAYNTLQNISTGAPQGSVLGPLLFNIFINDMFYIDLEFEICNLVDDTTIYACKKSIDTVIVKLEDDLQKILNWFKKTECVLIQQSFRCFWDLRVTICSVLTLMDGK